MDRYRTPNQTGGHDLTVEGWQHMAKMQAELAAATQQVADTLAIYPRESAAFQQAHRQWLAQQRKMLAFVGAGDLFDVAVVPRPGKN